MTAEVDVLQLGLRVATLLPSISDVNQQLEVKSALKALFEKVGGPTTILAPMTVAELPALALLVEAGYGGIAFSTLPPSASSKNVFLSLLRNKLGSSGEDYEAYEVRAWGVHVEREFVRRKPELDKQRLILLNVSERGIDDCRRREVLHSFCHWKCHRDFPH